MSLPLWGLWFWNPAVNALKHLPRDSHSLMTAPKLIAETGNFFVNMACVTSCTHGWACGCHAPEAAPSTAPGLLPQYRKIWRSELDTETQNAEHQTWQIIQMIMNSSKLWHLHPSTWSTAKAVGQWRHAVMVELKVKVSLFGSMGFGAGRTCFYDFGIIWPEPRFIPVWRAAGVLR